MDRVNLSSSALNPTGFSDQSQSRVAKNVRSETGVAQNLESGSLNVASGKESELASRGALGTTVPLSAARDDALEGAVSRLSDYVQSVQRDLQFEIDKELGQTVVRVVDSKTQEVIRQIPDEVALRLAQNLLQDEPISLFNVEV